MRDLLAWARMGVSFERPPHWGRAVDGGAGVGVLPPGVARGREPARGREAFLGVGTGSFSEGAAGEAGAGSTGEAGVPVGGLAAAFFFRAGAFFRAAFAFSAFFASASAFFASRLGHSGLMHSVHGGRPASIAVTTGARQTGHGG